MKHMLPLIAASLVGSYLLAASAFADMKGGERLITLSAPKSNVERSALAVTMMHCPAEIRTSIDQSARGAFKTAAIYTAHMCDTCKTKEISKGVGKMASHQLEHTCAAAANCCMNK